MLADLRRVGMKHLNKNVKRLDYRITFAKQLCEFFIFIDLCFPYI